MGMELLQDLLIFLAGHLVATTHAAAEPDLIAALRLGVAAQTMPLLRKFHLRERGSTIRGGPG
jgi:hypothetical protein